MSTPSNEIRFTNNVLAWTSVLVKHCSILVQCSTSRARARRSMRRLAEELGTGAASLYWHVGSKDGLLDLVFDQLIGEEQIPDPDPPRWQEQLKDIARAQRRVSLRHPYLVR